MSKPMMLALACPLFSAALAFAAEQQPQPVVSPAAKVERVATGFDFTEGPEWDGEQYIYFTDVPRDQIIRFNHTTGEVSVVRGNTGGSNGLHFDDRGRLIACAGDARALLAFSGENLQKKKVLAKSWHGMRLNSPNDLDIDAQGGIYFTDPRYGSRESMEMEVEAVYYLTPKGDLLRVIDSLTRPNGVVISRDGKTLYVVDYATAKVWAYDIQPDGRVSNGRVFASMDLEAGAGGDGMALDQRGNVYCAGQGHIWIWNPQGKLLTRIEVPEEPSNCTFGGPEGKTLYITARNSLYRISMNVAGTQSP